MDGSNREPGYDQAFEPISSKCALWEKPSTETAIRLMHAGWIPNWIEVVGARHGTKYKGCNGPFRALVVRTYAQRAGMADTPSLHMRNLRTSA